MAWSNLAKHHIRLLKLKSLLNFYINSSIHVAGAVVSLCLFTSYSKGLEINYGLLSFVFCSTLVGYNYVKYIPNRKNIAREQPREFKNIIILTAIAGVGLLLSCMYLSAESIVICSILSIFNYLYAIPIRHKTLRQIPYLKVFIIAFIWTIVSFVIPLIEANIEFCFTPKLWFEITERFCWIILLLIPFEIRDYIYDKGFIKTLAVGFGVRTLKAIGICVIFLLITARVIFKSLECNMLYCLIYFSLGFAILCASTRQNKYYASFWVEALPVFWMIFWIFTAGV